VAAIEARERRPAWLAFALVFSLAALPSGRTARAEPADARVSWDASVRSYVDDDHVSVISPAASVDAPLGPKLRGELAAKADIISAASVDIVTQASSAVMNEQRVEVAGGARWDASRLVTLAVRVIGSHENDYDALRASITTTLELAQRNTTLALTYVAAVDAVGHADLPSYSRSLRGSQAVLGLTQVVDRYTYVDALLDAQILDGYHGSPYRTVPLIDPASPSVSRVEESTPEGRRALAVLLRARRAFAERLLFVHAEYRFYADSWDVASHTLGVWLIVAPSKRLTAGAQFRGYTQSAASFYQPYYYAAPGTEPLYRTRDRTLGGMTSGYGALLGEVLAGGDVRLTALVGAAHFSFWNFPAQSARNALLISLGATGYF
jgi:hypothetical protein